MTPIRKKPATDDKAFGEFLPSVTGSSMGLSRVGGRPGVRHVLFVRYQHRSREG